MFARTNYLDVGYKAKKFSKRTWSQIHVSKIENPWIKLFMVCKCFHRLFASEEREQSEVILFSPKIVGLTSEFMLFRAGPENSAK